jgi:hypothetical protein
MLHAHAYVMLYFSDDLYLHFFALKVHFAPIYFFGFETYRLIGR